MVRYLLAVLLVAIGAVGAVAGFCRPWRGGQHAADFALTDLLTPGQSTASPGFAASVAGAVLVGLLAAAIGVLVRVHWLAVAGWLVCAVPTGLWALQAADDEFMIPDLQAGFTNAAIAIAALLLALLVVPARRAPEAAPEPRALEMEKGAR
ncbi:hypothetical protein [Amycolatopsis anabasis]|uniref:hypothetical protein n=1 Tax=Amycolatopsis anabasis TaxID=1840409 RepID=UPI00131C19FF|nr:hypothetical protein [Amycolatopsis anabasis]